MTASHSYFNSCSNNRNCLDDMWSTYVCMIYSNSESLIIKLSWWKLPLNENFFDLLIITNWIWNFAQAKSLHNVLKNIKLMVNHMLFFNLFFYYYYTLFKCGLCRFSCGLDDQVLLKLKYDIVNCCNRNSLCLIPLY